MVGGTGHLVRTPIGGVSPVSGGGIGPDNGCGAASHYAKGQNEPRKKEANGSFHGKATAAGPEGPKGSDPAWTQGVTWNPTPALKPCLLLAREEELGVFIH